MQFRGVEIPTNLYQAGFTVADDPATLKTPIDFTNINELIDEIDQWDRIGGFNKKHSSYGLKHVVEYRFLGKGYNRYVSNGEFIAAMILAGFKYKVFDGKNAMFNVSEKSLTDYTN